MLVCRFHRHASGRLSGFELSGHAPGAGKGSNLVCAGVTTLAQTCVTSLTTLLGLAPEIRQGESGYLGCRLAGDPGEKADLLFRTMAVGLEYLNRTGDTPGIAVEYTN